jgi:hypothetical protein
MILCKTVLAWVVLLEAAGLVNEDGLASWGFT